MDTELDTFLRIESQHLVKPSVIHLTRRDCTRIELLPVTTRTKVRMIRTFLFSVLLPREEVLEKMLSWSLVPLETAGPRPVLSWLSRGTVPSSGTA